MTDAHGLAPGTRMRILSGTASPQEITAVLLAIDQATRRDRAARARPTRPAWQLAGRLESLGAAPIASGWELRARR